MKFIDFKNIFQKIHLPKHGEYRTISAKARHDWKVLLITFFVLALVVIGAHAFLFVRIVKTGASSSASTSEGGARTVSQKNLEDTVVLFTNRKARSEELKTIRPSVPDPSL